MLLLLLVVLKLLLEVAAAVIRVELDKIKKISTEGNLHCMKNGFFPNLQKFRSVIFFLNHCAFSFSNATRY